MWLHTNVGMIPKVQLYMLTCVHTYVRRCLGSVHTARCTWSLSATDCVCVCVCVSAASTLLNTNRGISGEGSEGDVRYFGTQCPYLGQGLTVELETLEGDVSPLKL